LDFLSYKSDYLHGDMIYGSRAAQNANPENANRYTPLRWAKVFTEQADRLLPK